MASAAPTPRRWTRRRTLTLALAALAPGAAMAQERGPVLLVSRRRMLNETRQARALVEAEQRMTAELQARIDRVKRELAETEQELARLRESLSREEFEERTQAFDRRVRRQRREAQRQAAALQNAFRAMRVQLLEAMDRFLRQVRAQRGARLILDADSALAWDPAADITGEVIAAFNTNVSMPQIPGLETLLSRGSTEEEGEAQ